MNEHHKKHAQNQGKRRNLPTLLSGFHLCTTENPHCAFPFFIFLIICFHLKMYMDDEYANGMLIGFLLCLSLLFLFLKTNFYYF